MARQLGVRTGRKLSPEASEAEFVKRDVVPIFRDSLRRIAALRPPASDQPTVRGLLAAGHRGLARLEANPESLKAPPGSAKDPFREFGRRAEAYGLRCGG